MKTHACFLAAVIVLLHIVNSYGQTASIESLLDSSFAPRVTRTFEGREFGACVRVIALQPDGKVLINGDFDKVNGVTRAQVARLNADGTLDTSFDVGLGAARPDGCTYGLPFPLAVTEGAIFVGGNFTSFSGADRTGIAKLNSDGALDVSFKPALGNPNPGACGVHVSSIVIQSDGKILIGGALASVNGVRASGLARLNSDGTLDMTFSSPLDAYSQVTALASQ